MGVDLRQRLPSPKDDPVPVCDGTSNLSCCYNLRTEPRTHGAIVELQPLQGPQSLDGGVRQVTVQRQLVLRTGPLRVEVAADDVSSVTSCHAHHLLDGASNLGHGKQLKTYQ